MFRLPLSAVGQGTYERASGSSNPRSPPWLNVKGAWHSPGLVRFQPFPCPGFKPIVPEGVSAQAHTFVVDQPTWGKVVKAFQGVQADRL
jgi:hypothetical protein